MGGYIQAADYTSTRYGAAPRLAVLHTMETPCQTGRAHWCVEYFATPRGASTHWAVDPADTWQGVAEEHMAWAAPGANTDGIQIEQAGYAAFEDADWAGTEPQLMIVGQTAPLLAAISKRWGIPLVWLTNDQIAAGHAGVCHHRQISEVYRRSDHWDTGYHYPYDRVIALANGQADPGSPLTPPPPEDEPMIAQQVQDANGTVWAVWGLFKTPINSEPLRGSMEGFGLLKPGVTKVHNWTLDEFIEVNPGDFQRLAGGAADLGPLHAKLDVLAAWLDPTRAGIVDPATGQPAAYLPGLIHTLALDAVQKGTAGLHAAAGDGDDVPLLKVVSEQLSGVSRSLSDLHQRLKEGVPGVDSDEVARAVVAATLALLTGAQAAKAETPPVNGPTGPT